jgi:hypothetical protein
LVFGEIARISIGLKIAKWYLAGLEA